MERDIEKHNLEMCLNVLKRLIDRGVIESAEDAFQKLQEDEWLDKQGYGHVAHLLRISINTEECRALFAESKKTEY